MKIQILPIQVAVWHLCCILCTTDVVTARPSPCVDVATGTGFAHEYISSVDIAVNLD
jgi:hypothetical protein